MHARNGPEEDLLEGHAQLDCSKFADVPTSCTAPGSCLLPPAYNTFEESGSWFLYGVCRARYKLYVVRASQTLFPCLVDRLFVFQEHAIINRIRNLSASRTSRNVVGDAFGRAQAQTLF